MFEGTDLRLSAQRAFLERVHSEMRLIKIKSVDDAIILTVVVDHDPDEKIREDISIAATEIIADFASAKRIEENVLVDSGPIAVENILAEGWIYRRAE